MGIRKVVLAVQTGQILVQRIETGGNIGGNGEQQSQERHVL